METKLTAQQKELYGYIDKVLYEEWDPIGVSDEPEARDEYTSYADQVFSRTLRGESAESIAEYLEEIITGHMGLPRSGDSSHNVAVAEKIIAKKQALAH